MPAFSFGYFYGRVTMFIINFVGNELMAMLMALQALPRSGVTYLSYRSSVIKANNVCGEKQKNLWFEIS